jgi:hypothetical protein
LIDKLVLIFKEQNRLFENENTFSEAIPLVFKLKIKEFE